MTYFKWLWYFSIGHSHDSVIYFWTVMVLPLQAEYEYFISEGVGVVWFQLASLRCISCVIGMDFLTQACYHTRFTVFWNDPGHVYGSCCLVQRPCFKQVTWAKQYHYHYMQLQLRHHNRTFPNHVIHTSYWWTYSFNTKVRYHHAVKIYNW